MRRLTLCLLAGFTLTAAGPARAQVESPPLRLLVPLPAGSTTDIVARLLGDALRNEFARPVIVDNRPGATGRIAADALMKAKPDGATLLVTPFALPVLVPLVFKDVKYDPSRDLAPVSQVATFEYALVVARGHPARSVAEFVDWARAHPERASYGTPAAGSMPHLLGTLLAGATGAPLVHVPYRGAANVEVDVMGGEVAAAISNLSDFLPAHRDGRLRILATAGARRSPLAPDVPTFREQGYPALEATGWHAVFAPKNTPQATIDRVSAAIAAALRSPEVRERMIALGLDPTGTTPQALAARVAADIERWRPIVKASGFAAD